VKRSGAGGSRAREFAWNDAAYVGMLAAVVSLLAFAWYFRHGAILLYGDATAHIHIARRVFDSRTPGLTQLGTVWLPLPHLLILPFILSYPLWQSGVGGSIPSMIAYVAGAVGMFRLVRGMLPQGWHGRAAAWGATLVFAGNPNLIYLQSTAMGEPLYLAMFIWATVFFSEFVQAARSNRVEDKERRRKALRRCGWVLAAAMLTRYDGWFAAAAFALAAFVVLWSWTEGRIALWRSPLRPAFTRFLLILAFSPVLWFTYNAYNWGNPLEFANGPYSARAIEAKAQRPGGWHYPGWHSPRTAATYFLKSARLNMAGGISQPETRDMPASRWRLQNAWLPLALLGTALLLLCARGLWPLLLLWLPLPFYTLSIAWGAVPIFVPAWWPFSHYNVRYGLQMLPAFAVFVSLAMYFLVRALTSDTEETASPAGLGPMAVCKGGKPPESGGSEGEGMTPAVEVPARQPCRSPWRCRGLAAVVLAFLGLLAGSYAVVWRAIPVCLREAQINSTGRVLFDHQLGIQLQNLPPGVSVLMYTASHAAALEFAGFPLRRTINETNNKLWRAALAAPAQSADYVVAFETPDDPVWRAVQLHADELKLLVILSAPNQPRALIYRRR
jgi:hypothetical protein